MTKKESKNNNQEGFSKMSINWLITIYTRIGEILIK